MRDWQTAVISLPQTISIPVARFGCRRVVGTRLCGRTCDGTPGWFCVQHDEPVAIRGVVGYVVHDTTSTEGQHDEGDSLDLAALYGADARSLQGDTGDVFVPLLPLGPVHHLPRQQSPGHVRRLVRLLRTGENPVITASHHVLRSLRKPERIPKHVESSR